MQKFQNYKLLAGLLALVMLAAACSKTEEPPRPVGDPLTYTPATKNYMQILDSIPEASLFKAAFDRAGMKTYLDSVNGTSPDAPYTFFVPANKILQQKGYSTERIKVMPVDSLRLLVGYLVLHGEIARNADNNSGSSVTLYPMIRPDVSLRRTTRTVFSKYSPYWYRINVGFLQGGLYLNGKLVKDKFSTIPATNGSIVMIDSLAAAPQPELYQVITSDTAYAFYLAALRKSNEVYADHGLYGAVHYNTHYNDTIPLMLQATPALTDVIYAGSVPCGVFFLPDNNAFRKAGFASENAIREYIDKSTLVSHYDGSDMLTNMDSILMNHRLLSGYSRVAGAYGQMFVNDFPYLQGFDNQEIGGSVFFTTTGGQTVLHRTDFPNARGARIIPEYSNVNTLNGVIHRVDNLLLPTL